MNPAASRIGAEAERIPGYLLWQVSKLWQRSLNAALKDLHLSSTQAVILINIPRLNQERKTVTQMLLAEMTKIDRMTLSQSIRTLERNGLIKRITASTNKRAYHVELTAAGSEVAMKAMQLIITAHGTFFGPISDKAEEYVSLTQQLIMANKNITEGKNETNR